MYSNGVLRVLHGQPSPVSFLNAIYFIVCMTRCKTIKLEKKNFKLKGKVCGKMSTLGLSSFITQFALVIVIATVNNTLKNCGADSKYGADILVSAMGVVMKVSHVLTSIVLGIATGILPVISYNYGSNQHDRVKQLYKKALTISTITMAVSWLILEIFPGQIVVLVPTVLLLGMTGNVLNVLWAGPISDGVSCIASAGTILYCWKKYL